MYQVSCQYARHNSSERHELGQMGASEALRAFDDFAWEREVEDANRLQNVSPTISVEDNAARRLIWVSVCGDARELAFVSECRIIGRKRLFGVFQWEGVVRLHRDGFTIKGARRALKLFLSVADEDLRALYSGRNRGA